MLELNYEKYISEQRVLNELNIEDWRHLSKDKIMAFASELPYMDPEVAKAAIAQFPKFAESCKTAKRKS